MKLINTYLAAASIVATMANPVQAETGVLIVSQTAGVSGTGTSETVDMVSEVIQDIPSMEICLSIANGSVGTIHSTASITCFNETESQDRTCHYLRKDGLVDRKYELVCN